MSLQEFSTFNSVSCYNFCLLRTVYAFWQSPLCESKKSVQKLARLAARNSGCENSDSSTRRANIIPNSIFFFLTRATVLDYIKRERMFVKYILRGNSSCKSKLKSTNNLNSFSPCPCKICFQQGLIVYQTPLFHQYLF